MSEREGVKQVIVIRRDLNMRRGKEIAQGAHAAMLWMVKRMADARSQGQLPWFDGAETDWLYGRFTKIVLQVPDLPALMAVVEKARAKNLKAEIVEDSGRTEFKGVPTITYIAIGPEYVHHFEGVTSDLEKY